MEEASGEIRLRGHTAAVDETTPWSIAYDILAGPDWRTRHVHAWSVSPSGDREVTLETDGSGAWSVDGEPRADLQGCLDIDLESSVCTNTLPVHRLGLQVGEAADAPAVYLRAADLSVERLDQRYRRVRSRGRQQRYGYTSPAHRYAGQLVFDQSGLILHYPGIAARAH